MARHSIHIKILNHAKSFDVCNKHQYGIYKVSLFSPVGIIKSRKRERRIMKRKNQNGKVKKNTTKSTSGIVLSSG